MTKSEYNPSTGLMHFTAATGKVQVVGGAVTTCEDCSPSPDTVDVEISGVVQCCSTQLIGPFSAANYSAELFTAINDTHTLLKHPFIPCRYSITIDMTGSGAVVNTFISEFDCTGIPDLITNVDSLSIGLVLSSTAVYDITIGTFIGAIGSTPIQGWSESATACWDQPVTTPLNEFCGDPDFYDSLVTCIAAGGTAVISETP